MSCYERLIVPRSMRVASTRKEMWAKRGRVYAAEDVLRRSVLIVAQRMSHLRLAIEDLVGEPVSLASLYEAAQMKQRKGRTGSFAVRALELDALPSYLDSERWRFDDLVIATPNLDAWRLAPAAAAAA